MRPILFLPLLFFSFTSFAQQQLNKEQINRLADAGKVYGYIKYFHPYLQYRTLNWDSVFTANVEGIIKAKNKEEYADVMQRILATLNDNLTCIVKTQNTNDNYQIQPTTWKIKDSLLYISTNDINDNSYGKITEAYQNISKVKGVVFDMRKSAESQFIYFVGSGQQLDWTIMFSDAPLFFMGEAMVPSLRSVNHRGSYLTSFKQTSVFKITSTAKKNIPAVFIVKNEDDVPGIAIALQQKGLAEIVQEDGKELALGRTIRFYIQDSLIVKMRVAESINADGSMAVVHPDAVYSPSENWDAPIQLARKMIINGFKNQTITIHPAPQAITQTELSLQESNYPSIGRRMLAAARIFADMDNFFPAKDLMDKNWEECYKSAVPKFIDAYDSLEYLRAVAELYSNLCDSHGFITNGSFSLKLNPIIQGRGTFIPPVITNVIEDKVVVTSIYNDTVCEKISLKKGDVIVSIDGKDPMKMLEEAMKYQCASTKASQTFYVSKFLLFGDEGQIRNLKVKGADGKIRNVAMPTLREFNGDFSGDDYSLSIFAQHVKPTFNLLNKEIGYVDLTSLLSDKDIDSMFTAFQHTKAIILDDRGFPHGARDFRRIQKNKDAVLVKYKTNIAISPNVEEIGAIQKNFNESLTIEQSDYKDWNAQSQTPAWTYPGKIIMLINEAPQSSGEDIALKWKISANATLIGSPTSGTDGNMTSFVIPGNITLWYTLAIASFPDGKRTQRVGVQPDIYVRPTIKGIQAGKDEVLDRAVKYVNMGK